MAQPVESDLTSSSFFKQAAIEWVKVICDAQHNGKNIKEELFDQIQELVKSIIEKNNDEFLKEVKRSFFFIDDENNNSLQNAMISMYGIIMPNTSTTSSSYVFPKKLVNRLLTDVFIQEKLKDCFKTLILPANTEMTVALQNEILASNDELIKGIIRVYLDKSFPDEAEKTVMSQPSPSALENAEAQGEAQMKGGMKGGIGSWNWGWNSTGEKEKGAEDGKDIQGSNVTEGGKESPKQEDEIPNSENDGIKQRTTLSALGLLRKPEKGGGGLKTNADLLSDIRIKEFGENAQDAKEEKTVNGQMKGGTANLLYDDTSKFHQKVHGKLLDSIGQIVGKASIIDALKPLFEKSIEKHFDRFLSEDFVTTNLFYFGLSYTDSDKDRSESIPTELHTKTIYSKIHLVINEFIDTMRMNLVSRLKSNELITESMINDALKAAIESSSSLSEYNKLVEKENANKEEIKKTAEKKNNDSKVLKAVEEFKKGLDTPGPIDENGFMQIVQNIRNMLFINEVNSPSVAQNITNLMNTVVSPSVTQEPTQQPVTQEPTQQPVTQEPPPQQTGGNKKTPLYNKYTKHFKTLKKNHQTLKILKNNQT